MTRKNKIEKIITKSLSNKWAIKIQTSFPDNDTFEGIVLHNSNNLVIIQEFRDFQIDGIVALNKKKIKSCRDGIFKNSFNTIIRHNKIINSISKVKWYTKINGFNQLFKEIKKRKIWPIVEMISKSTNGLYIGPIFEVSTKIFSIFCYDAEAKWEGEYELSYTGIGKVEIESNYANTFNKYMKEVNPTP